MLSHWYEYLSIRYRAGRAYYYSLKNNLPRPNTFFWKVGRLLRPHPHTVHKHPWELVLKAVDLSAHQNLRFDSMDLVRLCHHCLYCQP